MKDSDDRVSVIIPTYNSRAFLHEALGSVERQTHKPFEVIVVDDGSTDNTRKSLKDLIRARRIRYIYQQNRGVSAARNAGMRAAGGDYIAFLDADDRWHPEKLARQLEALRGDRNAGFVYCDCRFVDGAGTPIDDYVRKIRLLRGPVALELFCDFFLVTSTLLMRRSCMERTGLFGEHLTVGEDYEYFLRMATLHAAEVVPERLVDRRVIPTSLSRKSAIADAKTDIRTLCLYLRGNPGFYRANAGRVRERLREYLLVLGYSYLLEGRRLHAAWYALRALRYGVSRKAVKYLVKSFVPPVLLKRLHTGVARA